MPIRSCVGCRRRRPQFELVRVTRVELDGESPILRVDGASCGRGAWLCRAPDATDGANDPPRVLAACLERAIAQRQFARAWRVKLGPGDVAAIRAELSTDEEDSR